MPHLILFFLDMQVAAYAAESPVRMPESSCWIERCNYIYGIMCEAVARLTNDLPDLSTSTAAEIQLSGLSTCRWTGQADPARSL